jgi:hypothetical protein
MLRALRIEYLDAIYQWPTVCNRPKTKVNRTTNMNSVLCKYSGLTPFRRQVPDYRIAAMKQLILLFSVVVVTALWVTGCQTGGQARVVRVMLDTNSVTWRLSVNGTANDPVIAGNDLTNILTRLRLRHGDLILLGSLPNRKSGPMADTWAWFARYCDSNNVAVYLYGVYSSSAAGEMFSIPVYHWVAPFDNPMRLESASFFREAEFLGNGSDGFKKMLDEISQNRPKKIFVLGSLYDLNRSFPPLASPYDHQRGRLNDVSAVAGTQLILLDPEPGF